MRRFAALYAALDASTRTEDKLAALVAYLDSAPPADAAWAVYLLSGGRPRRLVPSALLRQAARDVAGLPEWLFDASYQHVGDLAETLALVLPPPRTRADLGLAAWMVERLLPLQGQPPDHQRAALLRWWDELDAGERFLLIKLIGGGFRVGVSRLLVQRALARHAGLDPKRVAERMMGYTDAAHRPDAAALARLVAPEAAAGEAATHAPQGGQPYPFFLAQPPDPQGVPLPEGLGPRSDWLAEWKYDGIRAQLVRRGGEAWIWSRGEELVTEGFPEIARAMAALPEGTVLDGELLVWQHDGPAPFQALQKRLGRQSVSKRLLAEQPVVFIAFDLLQRAGLDQRAQPQWQRRAALEATLADLPPDVTGVLRLAECLSAPDWASLAALRADSRARGVEGLMLKHRDAAYGVGRTRASGLWWKWKIDPLTADAVLVYAQAGHGRRSGLYTDYTFALWNRRPRDADEAAAVLQAIAARRPPPEDPQALRLVPVAKAYSGLSDEEFRQVDREIRAHTLEKFGPVRSVRPTLVVELAFEGVQASSRHRSGVAVRFPRMLRIRGDKRLHEADDLPTLLSMMSRADAPQI